jgi:hypothetical protein
VLPKKSAAETGQKERAKTIPKRDAPHIPLFASFFCISREMFTPEKANLIKSRSIIPIIINPVRRMDKIMC